MTETEAFTRPRRPGDAGSPTRCTGDASGAPARRPARRRHHRRGHPDLLRVGQLHARLRQHLTTGIPLSRALLANTLALGVFLVLLPFVGLLSDKRRPQAHHGRPSPAASSSWPGPAVPCSCPAASWSLLLVELVGIDLLIVGYSANCAVDDGGAVPAGGARHRDRPVRTPLAVALFGGTAPVRHHMDGRERPQADLIWAYVAAAALVGASSTSTMPETKDKEFLMQSPATCWSRARRAASGPRVPRRSPARVTRHGRRRTPRRARGRHAHAGRQARRPRSRGGGRSRGRSGGNLVASAAAARARCDVLVNAAGMYPALPLAAMTAAVWDRVLHVNVRAPMLPTVAFARGQATPRRGGRERQLGCGHPRPARRRPLLHLQGRAGDADEVLRRRARGRRRPCQRRQPRGS